MPAILPSGLSRALPVDRRLRDRTLPGRSLASQVPIVRRSRNEEIAGRHLLCTGSESEQVAPVVTAHRAQARLPFQAGADRGFGAQTRAPEIHPNALAVL